MNHQYLSIMGLIVAEAANAAKEHWAATALLGATLALAGYAGRALHENLKARWNAQKNVRDRLQKLSLLLAESNSLFHNQNYKARELLKMLQQRLGGHIPADAHFDDAFYQLYPAFPPDDRHVHSLIRSLTMTSLRRVNTDISEWLSVNTDLRQDGSRKPLFGDLATQLAQLGRHLNEWHSKYHALFLQDETDHKHCLVYLGSERRDGTGFPKQLEPALARVLSSES